MDLWASAASWETHDAHPAWSSLWDETCHPGLIPAFPQLTDPELFSPGPPRNLGLHSPQLAKPLTGVQGEGSPSLDGQQTRALLVTHFLGRAKVPSRRHCLRDWPHFTGHPRFLHDFPAHASSSLHALGPSAYWPLSSLLPAPGGLPVKTDTQTHRLQKHGTLEGQPVESTPDGGLDSTGGGPVTKSSLPPVGPTPPPRPHQLSLCLSIDISTISGWSSDIHFHPRRSISHPPYFGFSV